jgi:DNA-binding NtrC family response regulator
MAEDRAMTLPHARADRLPVRAVSVEVLEGPDAGKTAVAKGDRLTIGTASDNDLVLTDGTVSGFHVALARTDHGVALEDKRSTNGTFVSGLRIERGVVPPGSMLSLGKTVVRVSDAADVEVELHGSESLAGLRGRTAAMRRLLAQIERAAKSEVSVLLFGESGTGKELVARALHDLGARKAGPFVTVDCASLSPTLVASELFGHEKGAFTGADRRHQGAFERAHGGTIFLDEIGELPESLQPTLLGALERKRIRRLGGREEIPIDVRVVCATHRDLQSEVNVGRFRLDLYYRVAVVRLAIPALRERPDDIPLLVEHFCREAGHNGPIEQVFSASTMASLRRHDWPGNVRELRNVVDATLAMGEPPPLSHAGGSVAPAAVTPAMGVGVIPLTTVLHQTYKDARNAVLAQFETAYLKSLLERAEGNVSQAARDADMDRSHLWDLLKRHGLK